MSNRSFNHAGLGLAAGPYCVGIGTKGCEGPEEAEVGRKSTKPAKNPAATAPPNIGNGCWRTCLLRSIASFIPSDTAVMDSFTPPLTVAIVSTTADFTESTESWTASVAD